MPWIDVGGDPTRVPLVSESFSREWAPPEADDPFQELPLRLTLHAASLDTYPLEAIDVLRDLDRTTAVDVLVSGEASWPDTTSAAPATITVDERALVPEGGPLRPRWWAGSGWEARPGFLPQWRWFQDRARARELGPKRTTWLLDAYGTAVVHVALGRHLLVTHNKDLLAERHDPLWAGVRIAAPVEALSICGTVLRSHNIMVGDPLLGVDDAKVSRFRQLSRVADDLIAAVDGLGIHNIRGDQIERLSTAGLGDRVLQVLHARDEVGQALFRADAEARIPAVHAVAGLAIAAFGLFETWAVLADEYLALGIAIAAQGKFPPRRVCKRDVRSRHWSRQSRALRLSAASCRRSGTRPRTQGGLDTRPTGPCWWD